MKPEKKPLGLYIHIPFCKQKCTYCDFYSLPGSESQMDGYVDALCAHLAELGFVVNGVVTVVTELAGNLILQVKDSRVALDRDLASRILV